jgi:Flp pilus assembly protein TadG
MADDGPKLMQATRDAMDARSSERGTALIEFALVLPLLLVLTVAVVDFSRAFYARNVVEQAAREGVRLLAVTSSADSALVRARVLEVAKTGGITVSGLTLTDPDAARQVSVTVDCRFDWLLPGVFNMFGAGLSNPTTLTGRAVMRDE